MSHKNLREFSHELDSEQHKLAQLGARVLEILNKKSEDTSGNRMWPAGVAVDEIEAAARSLGLLGEEAKTKSGQGRSTSRDAEEGDRG